MSLILANCTSKKRPSPAPHLRAASLPKGDLAGVVAEWSGRVRNACDRVSVELLYTGHSWRHARSAAQSLGSDLAVISAGLGVVKAPTLVPSYGLTVIDADDDIRRRVNLAISASDWWRAISLERLAGPTLPELLADESGLVLAALPDAYLAMIGDELAASRPAKEGRLRLFTGAPARSIPSNLTDSVMPYDRRLDDPRLGLGGTTDSFASRALRHFVQKVGPRPADGLATDHAKVIRALQDYDAPARSAGTRRTDAEIEILLRQRWDEGGGVTSRLLRILRDDLGVACEQGRLARLVQAVQATGDLDAC